jgi:pyruvate kinase
MEDNPRPTRAEANDVGTSIMKLSDAVMLSGESTIGRYPAEAVEFMSKVDLTIQNHFRMSNDFEHIKEDLCGIPKETIAKAKAIYANLRENDEILDAIIVTDDLELLSVLGSVYIDQPVRVITSNKMTQRKLDLIRGVTGTYELNQKFNDRDNAIERIKQIATENRPWAQKTGKYLFVIDNFLENDAIFEIVQIDV